jgi:hypothetical protein
MASFFAAFQSIGPLFLVIFVGMIVSRNKSVDNQWLEILNIYILDWFPGADSGGFVALTMGYAFIRQSDSLEFCPDCGFNSTGFPGFSSPEIKKQDATHLVFGRFVRERGLSGDSGFEKRFW